MLFKTIIEFLALGGVFLGVKNDSKNSGNKKNTGLFSKILSQPTYGKFHMFLHIIFESFPYSDKMGSGILELR